MKHFVTPISSKEVINNIELPMSNGEILGIKWKTVSDDTGQKNKNFKVGVLNEKTGGEKV